MADDGSVNIITRKYEDLPSLKKYVRNEETYDSNGYPKKKYDQSIGPREVITHINQLTTGTDAELEAGDGIAISQIGRAEIAVKLGAGTNDASHASKVFTLTYVNASGTSTTVTATGTATLADTQVAFSTDVTDFYYATSFTVDADFDNQDVYVETAAGSTVWATISAAGTTVAATEAQLLGVGAAYVRAHTLHADLDGAEVYMEYLSGTGTIKYAHGTIAGTETDEVRFFEATDDGDFTTTATTTTVKDFYRIRWLTTDTTPTANSNEIIITDADCANVDGSGGDIYGIIKVGMVEAVMSRYTPPTGYDAWLGKIEAFGAALAVGATTDTYNLLINYVPDGSSITKVDKHFFNAHLEETRPILLEEMTDIFFEISDNAGATTVTTEIYIVEAKRN